MSYLPEDSKLGHGINDAQESVDGLCFLADHRLVDVKLDLVMVEISLHLLAIDVEDIVVHDGKAAAPSLVAGRQLAAPGIKDPINEGEIIFDLLVALNVEAAFDSATDALRSDIWNMVSRVLSS